MTICMHISIKFENQIVEFLLCPPAQDTFRSLMFQEMLYNIRYEVYLEQTKDVMLILWNAYDELEKLMEWKTRGVDNKCS